MPWASIIREAMASVALDKGDSQTHFELFSTYTPKQSKLILDLWEEGYSAAYIKLRLETFVSLKRKP